MVRYYRVEWFDKDAQYVEPFEADTWDELVEYLSNVGEQRMSWEWAFSVDAFEREES